MTSPHGWALDVPVSLQTKVWQSLEMLFPGLLLTHLSGGCFLRQENLSSFLLGQVFLIIAKVPIILPFVSGFLKSVYNLLIFSNYLVKTFSFFTLELFLTCCFYLILSSTPMLVCSYISIYLLMLIIRIQFDPPIISLNLSHVM